MDVPLCKYLARICDNSCVRGSFAFSSRGAFKIELMFFLETGEGRPLYSIESLKNSQLLLFALSSYSTRLSRKAFKSVVEEETLMRLLKILPSPFVLTPGEGQFLKNVAHLI